MDIQICRQQEETKTLARFEHLRPQNSSPVKGFLQGHTYSKKATPPNNAITCGLLGVILFKQPQHNFKNKAKVKTSLENRAESIASIHGEQSLKRRKECTDRDMVRDTGTMVVVTKIKLNKEKQSLTKSKRKESR